jgi:flagellar biosynthesis/type III secretory pathway protein FliH
MSTADDVTKMEGYDENSYHKGFEEGHEVGFQEGVKRGQVLVLSEIMSLTQNAFTALTKDMEKENE